MVITFVFLLVGFVACQNGCSSIDERREIRDLSQGQRDAFFNAIKALATRGGVPSDYDRISKIHVDFNSLIHAEPVFLPWHRHYVHYLQEQLRTIDPSIVIPYWNSSADSQQPEASEIFTPSFMGGNGQRGNAYCVTDGPFANFQVSVTDDNPGSTTPHCLRRSFINGDSLGAFSTYETVLQITRDSRDYDRFYRNIERAPHALPHNNIGGGYGDFSTMSSPNDPLFWIHHGNVDYWYANWQKSFPGARDMYSADRGDEELPFFTGVRVSQTFNTEAPPYCYRYVPQQIRGQSSPVPPTQPSTTDSQPAGNPQPPSSTDSQPAGNPQPPSSTDSQAANPQPPSSTGSQAANPQPPSSTDSQAANPQPPSSTDSLAANPQPPSSTDSQPTVNSQSNPQQPPPSIRRPRAPAALQPTPMPTFPFNLPGFVSRDIFANMFNTPMFDIRRRSDKDVESEIKTLDAKRKKKMAELGITEAMMREDDRLYARVERECGIDICPPSTDRKDQRRLRLATRVPLYWIKHNKLGLNETRTQELHAATSIKKLNKDPTYYSTEALGMWSVFHSSSYFKSTSKSSHSRKTRSVKTTTTTTTFF